MPRFSTSVQFCSAVLLVAVAPGVRASDDILEGWDKYKFGMTIEQVRAVPGIAWGETEAQEFGNETSRHLKATAPVTIGGSTYNLNIVFKPDMLIRIDFEDKTPVKSIAACERKFTDALSELERRHGAFAATSKAGNTDTPFGTLNNTWRDAPTGSSKFGYLIATMQFEPKGPVHRSIELNAIRKFGGKWLSLRAISPNDITRCEVSIGYIDRSSL